jgi:hypothetical protein
LRKIGDGQEGQLALRNGSLIWDHFQEGLD